MLQLTRMWDDGLNPWEQTQPSSRRRGRPWLWIGLPLVVGMAIIAGMVTLALGTGFGTTRIWADVSLVFVLLPLCILGFIPLALLIALSFGTARLVGWLPEPLEQVVSTMERVAREARRGGKLVTRPMVALQGLIAMVETFLRALIGIIR